MRKILRILGFLYPLGIYIVEKKMSFYNNVNPVVAKLLLLVPVLYNIGGLFIFAKSLFHGPTFVERIARRFHPDLSDGEMVHCQQVTKAWCVFFIANMLIIFVLALRAPLVWWTIYTNVISYIMIGVMVVFEHILRWHRFPERKPMWLRQCCRR